MKRKRLIIWVFLFLPLLLSAQSYSLVSGENGMAATAHPLATEVAIEILKDGGNAIDAAVAAAFAIGVVEPDGSGIGGGGGMVVFIKEENKSYFINYYAKSPARTPRRFDTSKSRHSGEAICVPGTVAGLTLAHEKFGSLPLSRVLEPAIRLAEDGFPIDGSLGSLILDFAEVLAKDESTGAIFLDGDFPLMQGDILIQEDLATVLKEIAKKGRDGFYKGHIAESLVAGIKERGGNVSLKDLESYQPNVLAPLYGTYRGYEVLSATPPQSGASVIQGLNILENINLRQLGHYTQNPKTLHLIAETFRKVYTDRYYHIGDPDYFDVPVIGLTSKDYARTRFAAINQYYPDPPRYRDTEMGNPGRFNKRSDNVGRRQRQLIIDDFDNDFSFNDFDEFDSWGRRRPANSEKDSLPSSKPAEKVKKADEDILESILEENEFDGWTTHLSVIDSYGNAVSLTQTLGTFFGSTQTVNGVLFNNAMTNFSTTDNPNKLRRNKFPRTSIAPTIVLKDGDPFLIIGSPGGARIISTMLLLLVNVIDFDMNVEEANRAPRFFTQKWEDHLHLESEIGQDIIDEIEKMGHSIMVRGSLDIFFGGVQMILVDQKSGKYFGSADLRRGGSALGY